MSDAHRIEESIRGRGGQPSARYAFTDREGLMEALHIGEQASDMSRLLRDLNFDHPNKTTVERICYKGHLMKSGLARNMLRAFRAYAKENSIDVDAEIFTPQRALTDFGCRVVGLGSEIRRVSDQMLNSEINPVGDIAAAASVSPHLVVEMARGKCILVPSKVANDISMQAAHVLRLSEPLFVEHQPVQQTQFKPIGTQKVEDGAGAFRCADTATIRNEAIKLVRVA